MVGLLDQAQDQALEQEAEPLAAQYEDALVLAEEIATNEQGYRRLAETIAQGETVEEGLGTAAAVLMVQVERRTPLDGAVKSEFIGDVLEHIFEIGAEMGVVEESDITEQVVEQVTYHGIQRYAELKESMGEPIDSADMETEILDMDADGLINEARQALGGEKLDMLLQMAAEGLRAQQQAPQQQAPQQPEQMV